MSKYELPFSIDMAWCPGCGNFAIRKIIISALDELTHIQQKDVVFVSGIGQAAKMPQYLNVNYFNGLHGRALPVALAVKMANPSLTVIAEGGDGDMYGEGGNHFLHNVRRNIDISHIVHNNMVYGLTKGQASPTSPTGMKTGVQVNGVINEPFNPLAVAISLGATFVARAYSGEMEQTKEIIKKAVNHKGYALVDLLHPCVSFNKINTFKWYKENTFTIKDHDEKSRGKAWKMAMKPGKLGLGIYYKKEGTKTLTDSLSCYQTDTSPLYKRKYNKKKLADLIRSRV
jgi:2-oxoglutarate ferredoxin oxidoreductase subunit beta